VVLCRSDVKLSKRCARHSYDDNHYHGSFFERESFRR
jgi:hypothetical protein